MFNLDPALDRIPLSPDTIERVAWSLNLTSVAGMDFAGAEARAYAVTGAAGRGRSVCYVCLYVASLDRVQVFRHQDNPFPKAEGEAHEEEALAFLQDLGFILERVNYGGWSKRERQAWFDKQPPFHPLGQPPATRSVPVGSDITIPGTRAADPPARRPVPDEAPAWMEGLQTLAEPIEGPGGSPSPSPRESEQEGPVSRPGVVPEPSPPPLREIDGEPVAPLERAPGLEVERFSASGDTSVPAETFGGSLAEPPSDAPREEPEEATEPLAGTVPQAAPTQPAEPEAPEMEGLIFLDDLVEAPPPALSPPPRRAAQGAPRSRARTAVPASPPEEVKLEGRTGSGRPVKVDLPEEYEDLARLFASL